LPPGDSLNALLAARGTTPLVSGSAAAELLCRPQLHHCDLLPFMTAVPALPALLIDEVETELKYAGYVARQLRDATELDRLEGRLIPDDFDYSVIRGLRLEAVEKLERFRPQSVGQASRIAGVSPADVGVLLVALRASRGDCRTSETKAVQTNFLRSPEAEGAAENGADRREVFLQ
jgi:tRNA uridine 5-carboxymethylaminomethyl modification enzyme